MPLSRHRAFPEGRARRATGEPAPALPAEAPHLLFGASTHVGRLEALDLEGQLDAPPSGIGDLEALRNLRLSGGSVREVPGSLGRLGRLEHLEHLELRDLGVERLPDAIGRLADLRVLGLSKNALEALPEPLGALAKLERLDLTDNRLARLPSSLEGLVSLEALDLSRNRFEGAPASLRTLSARTKVAFEGNPLTPSGRREAAGLSCFRTARLKLEADRIPEGAATEVLPGEVRVPNSRRSDVGFRYVALGSGARIYADAYHYPDEGSAHPMGTTWLADLPACQEGAAGGAPMPPALARDDFEARYRAHALAPQLRSSAALLSRAALELGPHGALKLAARTVALAAMADPLRRLLETGRVDAELGHVCRAATLAAHGTLALLDPEEGPRPLRWPVDEALVAPPPLTSGKSSRHDGADWTSAVLDYDDRYQAYVRAVGAAVERALEAPVPELRRAFRPRRERPDPPEVLFEGHVSAGAVLRVLVACGSADL